MTKVASLRGFTHMPTCDKCGEAPIAPELSEYFSEERAIINLWTCARCGHRFETEAFEPIDATSKIDRQLIDEFLPALLVA